MRWAGWEPPSTLSNRESRDSWPRTKDSRAKPDKLRRTSDSQPSRTRRSWERLTSTRTDSPPTTRRAKHSRRRCKSCSSRTQALPRKFEMPRRTWDCLTLSNRRHSPNCNNTKSASSRTTPRTKASGESCRDLSSRTST